MPHRKWLGVLLLQAFLLFGPMPRCRAQTFVAHFEPPVLQRGKTTRVTVVGSRFGKPLGLWTSLPPGAVKATPIGEQTATKAVLDVTVAADAPVGICGVRLATDDGLANACLMLIDDLPVRAAALYLPVPSSRGEEKSRSPVAAMGPIPRGNGRSLHH